ncbi:hypothetical protein [Roseateles asaccharophilus]|uniref:Ankyrin repeat domain-containing protein n=1 Tax=Roseateles asaccharophilus TaxID=582607 RepID=A0ABU2A4S1_9BURK|nr:hypothetical protein [Roseateles asaccharophilus]MDR7332194.1 hypothetical protein [Roseateles asaccharophilus]
MKLIALLALASALQTTQAEPDRTPRQLIDRLGVEVRQVLEKPDAGRTPEDVERAVADRIAALVAGTPGHVSLTEADDRGRTPLMQAAGDGYALVVEALLTDLSVKQAINASDAAGETAWMKASFAPALTLVACQPGTLTRERYALLHPYLHRMNHLLKTKGVAIGATIRLLEAAGAEAAVESGKRAWLARCPNTSSELRQALAEGPLMRTLVNYAIARQAEFNKAASADVNSIPAKPPKAMKFIHEGTARRRVTNQKGSARADAVHCAMPVPRIPSVNWSGEMTINLIAATRAGVVEAADFEGSVSTGEAFAAHAFRAAILQALRDYRCEGEHVFAQTFMFKAE